MAFEWQIATASLSRQREREEKQIILANLLERVAVLRDRLLCMHDISNYFSPLDRKKNLARLGVQQ